VAAPVRWWSRTPAPCSHCQLHPAAPDRKQCSHCLEHERAAYRRRQERKHSAEGLAAMFKDIRRQGRQYVKNRPRKVIIELTPREVEMLERYGRRG
jgi:hypothetical protein